MRCGVLLLVVLLLPLAAAQPVEWTREDFEFESWDGTVLVGEIYRPADGLPAPAMLVGTGWRNDYHDSTPRGYSVPLADRGYVVVSWTARGFGDSGGEVGLDGPNEVADVKALLDWLAKDPQVIQDAPGDPRVGMAAESYAGAIQFLTAREDPRIDVIAPTGTWHNLAESLAPDDVLKRSWVSLLYASGTAEGYGIYLAAEPPRPNSGGVMTKLHEWYVTMTATNTPNEEIRQELGDLRSLHPGQLTTPAMFLQPWQDTLFPPSQGLEAYVTQRNGGQDARIVFFSGGHGTGGWFQSNMTEKIQNAWIAEHLHDAEPEVPPYPVWRHRPFYDDWVGEMQWPPAGTTYAPFFLDDAGLVAQGGSGTTSLVSTPIPSDCTEISNFQSSSDGACGWSNEEASNVWMSPALSNATEVTGTPLAIVQFDTNMDEAFLFFSLIDVSPDGSQETVMRHVMPKREPGDAGNVFVEMETVSHLFEAGHRIGLKISTGDLSYTNARDAGTVVIDHAGSQFYVPTVPEDAHGDRRAPMVSVSHESAWTTRTAANTTFTFMVSAVDDLYMGDINVTAEPGLSIERIDATRDGRTQTATYQATVLTCGPHQLIAAATDMVGNNVTVKRTVQGCPEIDVVIDDAPDKKSPGPLLLLPLALAFALRRRR